MCGIGGGPSQNCTSPNSQFPPLFYTLIILDLISVVSLWKSPYMWHGRYKYALNKLSTFFIGLWLKKIKKYIYSIWLPIWLINLMNLQPFHSHWIILFNLFYSNKPIWERFDYQKPNLHPTLHPHLGGEDRGDIPQTKPCDQNRFTLV